MNHSVDWTDPLAYPRIGITYHPSPLHFYQAVEQSDMEASDNPKYSLLPSTILCTITDDSFVRVSELWAVINNAGVCIPGELQWLTWEQCQRSIQVNLEGAVRITKTFFPLLQKSSGELKLFPRFGPFSGYLLALLNRYRSCFAMKLGKVIQFNCRSHVQY